MNQLDRNDFSPLYLEAQDGNLKIFKVLVKKGANVTGQCLWTDSSTHCILSQTQGGC